MENPGFLHFKNKTNQLCVNIFTAALNMPVNVEPSILWSNMKDPISLVLPGV